MFGKEDLDPCALINHGIVMTVLLIPWGYIPGRPVLSLEQLIKNLVSIIVRDGNYLLNVGPTGDGEIEPCQVKRLAELGEWLTKYGKALYGTRGGPILPGDWGGSTYRGNKVYLHIINWEVQDSITFPAPGKLLSSYGLNCNQFNILEVGDSLEIQVAADARDPFDTIICLTFEKDIIWDGVAATEDDIMAWQMVEESRLMLSFDDAGRRVFLPASLSVFLR